MACGRSPRSKSKGTAAKRRWCRQGDQVAHEIENVSRVVDQANALGDIVDHSCSILWGKRMSAADADVTEPVLAKGRGNHSFNPASPRSGRGLRRLPWCALLSPRHTWLHVT